MSSGNSSFGPVVNPGKNARKCLISKQKMEFLGLLNNGTASGQAVSVVDRLRSENRQDIHVSYIIERRDRQELVLQHIERNISHSMDDGIEDAGGAPGGVKREEHVFLSCVNDPDQ